MDRKRWLAGQLQIKGSLCLDAGAVNALKYEGKSLLAVGVIAVTGDFGRGELVSCLNEHGLEIARGLINYQSSDMHLIAGQSSAQFERILGYADDAEVMHRDNIVLMANGI